MGDNTMQQVLRSAVNTWECDEMGHLNVRFYPAHAAAGVRMLLARCGLTPEELARNRLRLRFIENHIRFHRELPPGTPFAVYAGFIATTPEEVTTYCELRRAGDNSVAATVVSRVAVCTLGRSDRRLFRPEWLAALSDYGCELPPHGAPRGVLPTPPRTPPDMAEAIAVGMAQGYLGPVDPIHVDADGFVEPAGLIARVSDGIQHFFLTFAQKRGEGIGGAVLEFRLVGHHEARRHDFMEVRSGLKAVASKTRHFCHWIFDPTSGACLATAEVVAVSFDLKARRAVAFSDEDLATMRARILPGISA